MKVILEFDDIDENNLTDIYEQIIRIKQRLGLLYDVSVRITKKDYNKLTKGIDVVPTTFLGLPLEVRR